MPLVADSFSSPVRPVLRGRTGAVAAAHPLAVAAGQEILLAGGTAADAAIAAQAVLCVVMPDACGLGGDMLALVHRRDEPAIAINGTGAAPLGLVRASDDGANAVTAPGLVDAWCELSSRAGRLPLGRVLTPAVRLARDGIRVSPVLANALARHRERLRRGGAETWCVYGRAHGEIVVQAELAALLENVGMHGRSAFYAGEAAGSIARAIAALGGTLNEADLAEHRTVVSAPLETAWGDWRIAVQPPVTQGVLLAMAIAGWQRLDAVPPALHDHVAIELTQAAFAHRADAARGRELLDVELQIDLARASNRGGPRAYLHTAGVAVADAAGTVVSSLVSVFDDFGSCVYVPGLGITLNDRAGGFTDGANAAAPGKRPVHTLAPMLLTTPEGTVGLATPGADGQVQTLLQVLAGLRLDGLDLARALARPRWRSENARLLIERSHAGADALQALGHRLEPAPDGDVRFGAVVCAGDVDREPIACADWRRDTSAGVT